MVFLQYAGETPSLAGCAKCHLKFFTPQELMKQPEAAAEYLREKFSLHTCKGRFLRRQQKEPCKYVGSGLSSERTIPHP
jgi:hypothetical protein